MNSLYRRPAGKTVSLLLISTMLCLARPAAARPTPRPVAPTVEALLKQAEALILIGGYERAVDAYRQVLATSPKSVEARVRLAQCLWRLGKLNEALQLLEAFAAEATPPVDALVALADIHLEQKEYLKATAVLEKLLAQRGHDLKVKLQLADCYRQMAQLNNPEARARALQLYREVEQVTKDPELRRQAMEAGLTMRFGELGEKLLLAKQQLGEGKTVDALQLLNALARQNDFASFLHYLRGMAYLSPAVDDRKNAIAAFAKAAGEPEAARQLGIMFYEDGELPQAENQLRLALKADPGDQKAHYHLGLVYREQGNDAEAMAAWRKTVELGSSTAIARWATTKMQVLSGDIRSLAPGQVIDPATEIHIGKKTCERIEQRWPVLKDARLEARLNRITDRLLRNSDRPKRDLRYGVAVINVPVANALTVPNGKIYFFTGLIDLIRTRMGDSDDAYASVLAHEISHNVLRHNTGMIRLASTEKDYSNYGQLSRLMGAVSRAHEFEADQYGALYAYRAGYDPSLSVLLHQKMMQQQGEIPRGMIHPRHRERIAHLRDYLLELRAKAGHFNKGIEALKKDEHDKAIDHFELFLGVFPDSSAARNNLALALHRKALLQTRAAPVFRRSTDIDPDARIKLIKLRAMTDEDRRSARIDKRLMREAVGEYGMVVHRSPQHATGHNNIATALSDLGELSMARKHLELALRLRPSYKAAHNNLGVVLAQLKDYRGAKNALRRAIALDGKFAMAHFNLALVEEKLGEKAEAIRSWERYVALDPTSGWAAIARARRAAIKV